MEREKGKDNKWIHVGIAVTYWLSNILFLSLTNMRENGFLVTETMKQKPWLWLRSMVRAGLTPKPNTHSPVFFFLKCLRTWHSFQLKNSQKPIQKTRKKMLIMHFSWIMGLSEHHLSLTKNFNLSTKQLLKILKKRI